MKLKRSLAVLLVICLLAGVFPTVATPVNAAAPIDGLDAVTNPTIGETYYLAANVDGTLRYFYLSGSVTATSPYSLNTTDDVTKAKQVTLAAAVTTGKGEFQLDYVHNSAEAHIYCFDALASGANKDVMDTGTGSKYKDGNYGSHYTATRATFSMDEVNGLKVLRKYSNNNVLVVKELTHTNGTTKTYRMLGVPEADLANGGVYPVSLYAAHTHNYVGGVCSCGKKFPAVTPMTDPEAAVGSDRLLYLYAEDGDGMAHYMRPARSAAASEHGYKESVGNISPYGTYTSTQLSDAVKFSVLKATCSSATETEYKLQYRDYSNSTDYLLYLRNVGAGPGSLTGEAHDKHHLLWDAENEYFYRVHTDGKTYVLVMKSVSVTYAATSKLPEMTHNEWRITTAPVTELGTEGVYKVNLGYHDHTYEEGQCVCGDELEAIPLNEGIYYLKATRSGTTYYFRKQVSGESVGYTTPYSVYTDTNKSAATLVDVIKESTGGYSLAFPDGTNIRRIYVFDAGGSSAIDTGINAGNEEAKHHFKWDGYNGWLYQMEGDTKYVLAVKELNNTNTGTKQIRMQAVPVSELSDTVVPVQLEVHPTHTVDTWEVTTPPTTSTTGVKTGTCTVCGREVQVEVPVLTPSFTGNDLSLTDAFSLHFYVDKAAFGDSVYTSPYVIFDLEGEKTTVSAYTQDENSYIFTFDDITPDKMGQIVTATLYAKKQGAEQIYATKTYSVAQYCYDMLAQNQPSESLRTLLVDTLNFGAAAQKYRGSTEELVNAKLTAEQKAWGTSGELRLLQSCKTVGNNRGEAKWYGVSALMGDRVQMRVYFEVEDAADLTVLAESCGNTWTLTDITPKDGRFYVDFSHLDPTQMSEAVTFTVQRGDAAISSPLCYSLESYAESWLKREEVSETQKELVTAMIRYGDAAKAYADRVYDLESDVLYMGRVYETNDTKWFNWSAAGFKVNFQGSGIKAQIASNAPNATNYAYLKVYVDGVEQEDVLVDEKLQTITLAEGLDPNETHTVEVRKRNSARSSTAGLVHLELTDGAKLARPADKERLIEFVGDSLTVGWSAAKGAENETAWSTKTEDGTRTYSKQVADAFNAEYMVTAISGRGVVMNNSGGGAPYFPDIYPKLDYYNDSETNYDSKTNYDFALQPDVIVINLGSNDATNSDLDLDVFKAGVISFIQMVREKNPNAKILWAYGMRDLRPSTDPLHDEAGEIIEAAIAELNDPNVYYMLLESVDPNTEIHLTHPIASSYVARGEAIIEKIEEITGWQ